MARLAAANARVIAARPRLRRVLGAWGIGIAAEWALLVALSITAYTRAGAAAVGVVGAARVVPAALAAPAVSTLVDRLPRGRVLALVLLTWAAIVALIPLALLAASLLPLYVAVAAISAASAVFRPAVNALVPQVVERPEELTAANSTYSTLEALGTLLGPLLAAALVGALPTSARYEVIAVVTALPVALVLRVSTDTKPPTRAPVTLVRRLLEPLAGFPALFASPPIRAVITVLTAQCAMRGLLNVFVVVAAVSVLGVGQAGTGSLFAALGVGGLVGAGITVASAASRRLALPYAVGMTLWGLPVLLIALWPRALVAWLALAVLGAGNAVADVNGFTVVHRLVPDHLLGRAFGALWGCAACGVAAGSVAAAPLIHGIGLRPAMFASGLAMALLPPALWPALRHVDAQVAVDEGRVAILRGVPLFAPLTRFALEHLARRAAPVPVDAGAAVVRQGELGDLFYVVESGDLSVRVDGVERNRLATGDCFGEIALLRRVPRTASVVALAPSRLLALDGATFVAAVTGNAGAESAALALADERVSRTSVPPGRAFS
jgi:MFS family permease